MQDYFLNILVFMSASVILIFNYVFYRNILHPSVFYSLLWVFILGMYFFSNHGLFSLSSGILLILLFSMFLFSFGGFFSSYVESRKMHLKCGDGGENISIKFFYKLYLFIAAVGLPFFIQKSIFLASHSTTDSFIRNVRLSLTHEDFGQSYGLLAYLFPISISSLLLMSLDKSLKLRSFLFISGFSIGLAYAVLSTGRTFIFLILIPLFYALILSRPKLLNFRFVFLLVLSLILSFFFIGMATNKLGDDLGEITDTINTYLLAGLPAFDQILGSNPVHTHGEMTLRTFYAVFEKLGFEVQAVHLVQEFVYVPFATNVFTVFYPYYIDFGIAFLLFFQFVFGYMHAYLFARAKAGCRYFILLFSLSMYPLFMQFFQDQYVSILTTWIIFMFLLIIPFIFRLEKIGS